MPARKLLLICCLLLSLTACASLAPPPAAPALTLTADLATAGLSGRLVLIQWNPHGNRLVELDLAKGTERTIFQAPDRSWFAEAAVSPDGQQILLSYAPPPPSGPQFGYTDLYRLPLSGASEPQPVLTRAEPHESLMHPYWAPDGESFYFTHLHRSDPDGEAAVYQNDVKRATLAGQSETLLEHALWGVLSPDGRRLAYLYADPLTFANDLYLANPDGSEPAPLLQSGSAQPVDAHLFTPDGGELIFSMVNLPPATPAATPGAWLDQFFGVQAAYAHSVPSDWYRLPLSGGAPQRLTNLEAINLIGGLSPDGQRMAFVSGSGLYVMDLDGGNLLKISGEIFIGSLTWLP